MIDAEQHVGTTDQNLRTGVGTKPPAGGRFDNYTLGFIRVRHRRLAGGTIDKRGYVRSADRYAISSTSFDLVRSVRVNGKPRHQFVLGLGSQKTGGYPGKRLHELVLFWGRAIHRMQRHGLSQQQRHHLVREMVRKGARLPTAQQLHQEERHLAGWYNSQMQKLAGILSCTAEAA